LSTKVTTTFLGREENSGKKYPMMIEKSFLLTGLVLFIFTFSDVSNQFENKWIGSLIAFLVYPFVILFTSEMIGRIIQRVHNDA
tara:strand:- start:4357 stop:4608 length:252 start_codon:yes stop_codon:yes gene_type:complete